MLALSEGRPGRAAGQRLALLPAPLLAGCTDTPASAGLWVFLSLALALTAVGGYALGAARQRRVAEQALRQARAALRHEAQLQEVWAWQTGAHHELQSWQGPGHKALAAKPRFDDDMQGALVARLRAEQPFTGLRLRTTEAQDGNLSWELSGVPRHDELGSFAGFVGHARPTGDSDRLQTDAAALVPTLAACTEPALVAAEDSEGWRVRHLNPAAALLWPDLSAGAPLADALARLPQDVRAAIGTASPPGAAAWRWSHFGPLPGGGRGLLLWRPPGLVPSASALASDATRESDAFSFTVSHDLRAPIRVVEGFTRIVKEDYGRLLDRVGNDHLDRVLGAAARMNLMIDALLTLARLSSQPLAHQPVNLSQLATFVVDDLRRASPERDADIEIEPGLATQGDPTLLRLVLENLLGNAWKYSARVPRAQISLRVGAHDGRNAYVVRDNGAGFDMRSADRLFGLFQRLHSASEFPGHGVGLASVRRIVQRHGGDIWAEAELGRGASFYFTLAS